MNSFVENMVDLLSLPEGQMAIAGTLVSLCFIFLIAVVAHFIGRLIILRVIETALTLSENKRDDLLVERHVFRRLVHIIPALIIYTLAEPLLTNNPTLAAFIGKTSLIYMLVMMLLFIDALLNVLLDIYRTLELSRHFPIKSFVQVAKLVSYIVAAVIIISIILGESPFQLIAGLGAITAILMLVFKDPILGFIAGLQLSSNRMVSIGDWIEIPKHGVDGDVLEIALTTVKIRNFDNTITTVPTQALINDSFKNWAGMQKSGGRRIKRAINIDLSSIRFCDVEMLERFSKIQYISEYITGKQGELSEFNDQYKVDLTQLANGRRLTNLGTFRAYLEAYLSNHPQINKDLTFLIRQLKPTETGVPIEIYVFSTEKRWTYYEGIQSDIFDHVLAVIPEFDLRVYQYPTGWDMNNLLRSSINSI